MKSNSRLWNVLWCVSFAVYFIGLEFCQEFSFSNSHANDGILQLHTFLFSFSKNCIACIFFFRPGFDFNYRLLETDQIPKTVKRIFNNLDICAPHIYMCVGGEIRKCRNRIRYQYYFSCEKILVFNSIKFSASNYQHRSHSKMSASPTGESISFLPERVSIRGNCISRLKENPLSSVSNLSVLSHRTMKNLSVTIVQANI